MRSWTVPSAISDHPEFAIIARRPAQIRHPALLRSLRMMAMGPRWSEDVLPHLSDMLLAHAVLDDDEAEWLGDAGPVWIDRRDPSRYDDDNLALAGSRQVLHARDGMEALFMGID